MEAKLPLGVAIERFDKLVCSQCECAIDLRGLEPFTRLQCPSCSHAATVPAKMGHFLLLDQIGTGGMGSVYVAEDETLERLVAIKVMLASLGKNAESLDKFRLEAQAAARLNHPNIAQIYSIGQEQGQPYIVMELVSGHGLDHYIERGKPFNVGLAMRVGLDVAEALRAAEETGLTHGDIKPENILIDEKGRTKLVDFGLASFADVAAAEGIWGTPYYVAPEKVLRRKEDLRSDIYSLGATLYHVIAGKPPFDAPTPAEVVKARLDAMPPPLRTVRPDVDPRVEALIARMLQTDPALRHPTYASLIGDFRKALESMPRGDRVARLKIKTPARPPETTHLPRVAQRIDGAAGDSPGTQPRIVVAPSRPRVIVQRQTVQPPQVESAAARARRKRRWRVVLWLLFLMVAGAGATAAVYLLHQKRSLQIVMRRERFALHAQRLAASNTVERIDDALAQIAAMGVTVAGWSRQASNAFFTIQDPVPTPAEWEALRTAAAATQAVATAAAATTNAPPPLTGAPPTNTVGTATNAPPSKEPPAPPPAQDSRPVAGLDVRACALRILASEAVIAHAARQAAAVRDDATIRLGLARQADTSAEAAALVTILTNGLARARACREEAFAQQERAKTAAAQVASLKSGVEAARLEQARLAVETARRQAAEELARKQREEHDALVAEEKTRAQAVRGTCAKLVLEYRFAEAVKAAEVGAKACKTDAGRGAFGVLADRYRLLQDLKAFIIERLNGDPRPWIWGSGSSAKDVLGADDAYIRVKGGSVAWKDVPPAQVLKFVNVYENSSDLRVRRQCALLLAAAVYCYEFGGLNAAVTAKNYAASAVRLCQDLQADVDRLLIYEAP